ncbi:MAG: oligosaccharide flippase family protein [Lentilitoribacter sp.]
MRNGILLAGTQWGETGIRAVYAILIAGFLGPELYGSWSLALATYTFAIGFTHFGLESLIPLRLGKDKTAGAFVGTTFLVRLALLIIATLLSAAWIAAVETDLFSRTALLIVLPALLGRGIVLWARSVFIGLECNQIAFRFAIGVRLFELVLGLTLLWLGFGLITVLIVHVLSWLIEAAFCLTALSRHIPLKIALDRGEFESFAKRGAILGLGTMGLSTLISMPIILTRYVSDDIGSVGQIAMAIQIASLVVMAVQGMFTAALPVISRAADNDDPRLRFYAMGAGLGVALVFGLAIVVAQAFGPDFMAFALGEGFRSAGTLLTPALIAAGLMIAPVGVWQILVTQDRIWSGVFASWSGALVLLIALPLLVQSYGPAGALFAAALGWALRAVILVGVLRMSKPNVH